MTRTGRFEDALYYFKLAKAEYQASQNTTGLYRTNLGMANLMIQKAELAEAERYLTEADSVQQEGPDYLVYLTHRQKIAFLKEDYRQALSYSARKLESARPLGYRHLLADAFSDHGFYQMLNGNYDEGLALTEEAAVLIKAIEDKDKHYYNQLNMLLYTRCQGSNTARLAKEVDHWAKKQSDVVLQEFLSFVLAWPCP